MRHGCVGRKKGSYLSPSTVSLPSIYTHPAPLHIGALLAFFPFFWVASVMPVRVVTISPMACCLPSVPWKLLLDLELPKRERHVVLRVRTMIGASRWGWDQLVMTSSRFLDSITRDHRSLGVQDGLLISVNPPLGFWIGAVVWLSTPAGSFAPCWVPKGPEVPYELKCSHV